jgi:hypothetical protein
MGSRSLRNGVSGNEAAGEHAPKRRFDEVRMRADERPSWEGRGVWQARAGGGKLPSPLATGVATT